MDITIKEAKPLIVDCFKARLVPMLHGSPGCGKSQIMADIAEELNLQMIDVRLAQMDSTDLNNI